MSDGAILEQIRGNRLAAERFEAVKEHLSRNGVDLSKTPLTLGPWLTMDPKTERFVGNSAADATAEARVSQAVCRAGDCLACDFTPSAFPPAALPAGSRRRCR